MFVALGIQRVLRKRRCAMCVMYGSIKFSVLSHKRLDIRTATNRTYRVRFDFIWNRPQSFLIRRRTERDFVVNVCCSLYKVPDIVVRFWWNLNFLDKFSKNSQISDCMEVSSVGADFFHADGRINRQTEGRDGTNSFCFTIFPALQKIPRSAHTVYSRVSCGSQNKQRLFPYTALTERFE